MHEIFLSYSGSTEDQELVQAVSEGLSQEMSLRVWKYQGERNISQRVDRKVKDAIQDARFLLVLFTRTASKSDWVQGELKYARELLKPIIFCQADDVDEKLVPIQFQTLDRIKFHNADDLFAVLLVQCREIFSIPVIIPSAGGGGGLYPISMNMPKALIPVGDKPMLHQIIMNLDSAVFSKVYVLVNAKRFKSMFEYYVDLLRPRVNISIEVVTTEYENLPIALKILIEKIAIKTTFLIHYSDIVLEPDPDWSWKRFIATHQHAKNEHKNSLLATLAVSPYYSLPIGVVKPDKFHTNLIKTFEEKPKEWVEMFNRFVNTAIALFEPEITQYINEQDRSLYGECLTRAISAESDRKVAFLPLRHWNHIQTIGDWWDYQEKNFRKQ